MRVQRRRRFLGEQLTDPTIEMCGSIGRRPGLFDGRVGSRGSGQVV